MSKIQKIRELLKEKRGLNQQAAEYLLWFCESQSEELRERYGLGQMDKKEAHIKENFPNNIEHHRNLVDQGKETRQEYELWIAKARQNKPK